MWIRVQSGQLESRLFHVAIRLRARQQANRAAGTGASQDRSLSGLYDGSPEFLQRLGPRDTPAQSEDGVHPASLCWIWGLSRVHGKYKSTE